MSLIETFQSYTLQLGQRRFCSRVALQPLFLNDILLFISQAKQRKLSQKSKPHAFGSRWFTSFPLPNCSSVPLLHLAVVFESKWKHFSSPEADWWRGGKVFAVARPFRTGLSTLPISPLPSSKPVVVRPLICCNLPLQPRCQNRSYFRSRVSSAAEQKKDTQENKRWEKNVWKKGGWVKKCMQPYCI